MGKWGCNNNLLILPKIKPLNTQRPDSFNRKSKHNYKAATTYPEQKELTNFTLSKFNMELDKWHPGIGDSFWKPSCLGSMLNLGRVIG